MRLPFLSKYAQARTRRWDLILALRRFRPRMNATARRPRHATMDCEVYEIQPFAKRDQLTKEDAMMAV
jgi:hypothetical protein